jgi:hypothetical protein
MKKQIHYNNEIIINRYGQIAFKKRFLGAFVLKFYRFFLSGL